MQPPALPTQISPLASSFIFLYIFHQFLFLIKTLIPKKKEKYRENTPKKRYQKAEGLLSLLTLIFIADLGFRAKERKKEGKKGQKEPRKEKKKKRRNGGDANDCA